MQAPPQLDYLSLDPTSGALLMGYTEDEPGRKGIRYCYRLARRQAGGPLRVTLGRLEHDGYELEGLREVGLEDVPVSFRRDAAVWIRHQLASVPEGKQELRNVLSEHLAALDPTVLATDGTASRRA